MRLSVLDGDLDGAIRTAAMDGNVSLLQQLLADGAMVNSRNRSGNTALHLAAHNNEAAAARVLLHAGVSVNTQNQSGQTALSVASAAGHLPVTTLLTAAGADIHTRTAYSSLPPLHLASAAGHAAVCQHLLDCGGDEDAADMLGHVAEDYAANVPPELVFRKWRAVPATERRARRAQQERRGQDFRNTAPPAPMGGEARRTEPGGGAAAKSALQLDDSRERGGRQADGELEDDVTGNHAHGAQERDNSQEEAGTVKPTKPVVAEESPAPGHPLAAAAAAQQSPAADDRRLRHTPEDLDERHEWDDSDEDVMKDLENGNAVPAADACWLQQTQHTQPAAAASHPHDWDDSDDDLTLPPPSLASPGPSQPQPPREVEDLASNVSIASPLHTSTPMGEAAGGEGQRQSDGGTKSSDGGSGGVTIPQHGLNYKDKWQKPKYGYQRRGGNFQKLKDHEFEWSDKYRERQSRPIWDRLGGGVRAAAALNEEAANARTQRGSQTERASRQPGAAPTRQPRSRSLERREREQKDRYARAKSLERGRAAPAGSGEGREAWGRLNFNWTDEYKKRQMAGKVINRLEAAKPSGAAPQQPAAVPNYVKVAVTAKPRVDTWRTPPRRRERQSTAAEGEQAAGAEGTGGGEGGAGAETQQVKTTTQTAAATENEA